MSSRLWTLGLVAGLSLSSFAQSPPPGLSKDPGEVFVQNPEKPWSYRPLNPEFWSEITTLLKEKKWGEVIASGARHAARARAASADQAEGELALAMGLRAQGLFYGAFVVLAEIAERHGALRVGEAALNELSTLALERNYDQETLETLLTSKEFGPLHPEVQSFVSYFRYIYNLKFGFAKWANQEKALISANSPWAAELSYWGAIGDVARNQAEKAEPQFQSLMEAPHASARIKQFSTLQVARLLFERGQFQAAHDLYMKLGDFGVREKGRVLLEIAWTKYYLKDYDKALGLLVALRAPYFLSSLAPERFVLETLMYRDLCHYQSAQESVARFRQNFHSSLLSIRRRLPLKENPILFNMALMDRDVQERANLIDQLRREREELKQIKGRGLKFYRPLLENYARRDRALQKELDILLEPRARSMAEVVLDADEQMQFLDYTSKIDALRIVQEGEDRAYQSQKISFLTFDSIFWPVDNEFWRDEFDDFKVLVSSRCHLTRSPAQEKRDREFR